jgi:hypothetical protein
MISTHVSGKVIAMWMPIMLFFYMVFEHSIVNMFLFPLGPAAWRALLVHGLLDLERDPHGARQPGRRPRLHGLTLYATHVRTRRQARRVCRAA